MIEAWRRAGTSPSRSPTTSTSSTSSAPAGGRPRTPARRATTPSPGSTRSRRRCRAASTGPSSRRCAAPWPRRWSPAPTSSSRPAPGRASRWPTWSRAALERQEGGRGHRHQGAAGPAGREGPAAGRVGARAARPARLRRPEGTEQLHLPPAGGRGGLGWDSARAGRPRGRAGPTRRERRRRVRDEASRPRRPRAWSRRSVAWWPGRRRRPAGDRADLSFEPSDRAWNMLSVGPGSARAPTTAPRGGAASPRPPATGRPAADIVVVNTHLYGAHLASGGAVLPEHDVVVFDEAHELEEVMTSSLGVEVTPGRFRSLVTAARPLVEQRDADAARLPGVGRRAAGRAPRRPRRDAGPARRRPAAGGRPRAGRAARPGRRARPARHRRAAAQRGAALASSPTAATPPTPTGPAARPARCRPRRTWPRTCTAWCRAPTARWPGSTAPGATSGCASPPSTSGPRSPAMLWGEVTSVLTSATIPPRIVERVGLEGFPTEELNVGSPFDYRSHALLYVARHLPDRRAPAAGGGAARGAGPADRGGRRAHAGPVHQPAGHRGGGARRWRPSSPTRSCSRATSPRAGCSRSSPGTRPRASSPRSASGRGSTSRAAPCRW